MSLIKEEITIKYVVKIGSVDVSLDNYELAILTLYLAYAVNTRLPHKFLSNKVGQEQKVSIYLRNVDEFSIVIHGKPEQVLPRVQLKELCNEIAEFSEDSPRIPLLIREEHWEQNDLELFYHVTKANVVAIVYHGNREVSDLPVGLHIDEAGCCWGVKAKIADAENEFVDGFYFDKDCEAYTV